MEYIQKIASNEKLHGQGAVPPKQNTSVQFHWTLMQNMFSSFSTTIISAKHEEDFL